MTPPNWLIWTCAIACEAGILLLTFFSNARRFLGPDPNAFYVIISSNLALLLFVLTAKLELLGSSLGDKVGDVSAEINRLRCRTATVEALVDHDFYARFGARLRDASVGVGLTHLDTLPPNRPRKTDAAEYYSGLYKTIKGRPRVRFRRVERASLEKRTWIEQLVSEYRSVENFSLGVLLSADHDRHTGLLSVQVVDDIDTVLVAVAEHDSSYGVRDLWVSDKECTRLWSAYYENALWRPAAKIIENGIVNEKELHRVVAFIEAQCQSS